MNSSLPLSVYTWRKRHSRRINDVMPTHVPCIHTWKQSKTKLKDQQVELLCHVHHGRHHVDHLISLPISLPLPHLSFNLPFTTRQASILWSVSTQPTATVLPMSCRVKSKSLAFFQVSNLAGKYGSQNVFHSGSSLFVHFHYFFRRFVFRPAWNHSWASSLPPLTVDMGAHPADWQAVSVRAVMRGVRHSNNEGGGGCGGGGGGGGDKGLYWEGCRQEAIHTTKI